MGSRVERGTVTDVKLSVGLCLRSFPAGPTSFGITHLPSHISKLYHRRVFLNYRNNGRLLYETLRTKHSRTILRRKILL
jgi:hypothetical protein